MVDVTLSYLNDMANTYKTIALRALNATKTVNPITYLGIRCFLDSFSNEFDEDGLEHFIRHKLKVRHTRLPTTSYFCGIVK
jgi:hypothetical protein